jgi:hypothetical protein
MSDRPIEARITPYEAGRACQVEGCENDELLATVEPEDRSSGRILCPRHRVEYLREVNNQ